MTDIAIRVENLSKQYHIVVWGTGAPAREFLYVEDAAEGVLLAGGVDGCDLDGGEVGREEGQYSVQTPVSGCEWSGCGRSRCRILCEPWARLPAWTQR